MKEIPQPLRQFLTEEAYDRIEFAKAIYKTDEIPIDELREIAVTALKSKKVTPEVTEAVREVATLYMFDIWKQGHTISNEKAVCVNPYTNKSRVIV